MQRTLTQGQPEAHSCPLPRPDSAQELSSYTNGTQGLEEGQNPREGGSGP